MTLRRHLIELLSIEPRTASSIARQLGLRSRDVEAELPHLLRSARAAGHRVIVEPAECRGCGFRFDEDTLHKPGKCPACRGTRLAEPSIRLESASE